MQQIVPEVYVMFCYWQHSHNLPSFAQNKILCKLSPRGTAIQRGSE